MEDVVLPGRSGDDRAKLAAELEVHPVDRGENPERLGEDWLRVDAVLRPWRERA